MRSRLLLAAAPLVLWVWLASGLNCSSASVSPRADGGRLASAAADLSVTATPTAPPDLVAPKAAPDALFVSTVRPILQGHCAPCHEPGGVMYERLPFDQSETVASHSAGVLKRIKTPDERAAIERWLSSKPSS